MGGEDEKDGSPVVLAPVPNWIGYGQKYAFTDFFAVVKMEMKFHVRLKAQQGAA